VSLKGGKELRARLKAVRLMFKPAGKAWADEYVNVARPMVPSDTNRLRNSIKRTHATQRKATVGAHYSAYFVDKGPKRHPIKPSNFHGPFLPGKSPRLAWTDGGRTIFARRVNHPGYRGRPFRARAAREALRRKPLAAELIRQWNSGA
jgi:hypothetical protein